VAAHQQFESGALAGHHTLGQRGVVDVRGERRGLQGTGGAHRHSTIRVAFMPGWKVQTYSYLPRLGAACDQLLPTAMAPESNTPLAVAVCGTTSLLFQTMRSPALTVTVSGANFMPSMVMV